jgi:hypothetical protein
MPPLISSDRPIWLTPPAVFVQRSATTSEQLNEEFTKLLAALNPLNALLRELDRFLNVENYNGLTIQLDRAAHKKAHEYLANAGNAAVNPMPELTPDGDGGIEIEWRNKGRRLVLSIKAHPDDTDFISWREPQGQYEGNPASQDLLTDQLAWLVS